MDRFQAMRVFVRVVEAGSLTQAAQTLQLGRATVTQLLKQLETHLQVRLLHRTTRKLSLTDEGAAYYQRAVQLLAGLEEAEASVGRARSQPRGRLRIDVPSPFAQRVLMPALPDFLARYPGIELAIGASDREVDVIGQGVDGVIRGGELRDGGLVARRLCELPLALHAAPAYLTRCGTPADPQQLQDPAHRLVGFRGAQSGEVYLPRFSRGGQTVVPAMHCQLSVDDGNACLAAGLAGLGIICLPTYMTAAHVRAGELVPLLAEWQLPTMPLHLVFAPNRHVSHRLRVFIDWMVEHLQPGLA